LIGQRTRRPKPTQFEQNRTRRFVADRNLERALLRAITELDVVGCRSFVVADVSHFDANLATRRREWIRRGASAGRHQSANEHDCHAPDRG